MKERIIELLMLIFIATLILLLMIQFDKIYFNYVMNSDLSEFEKIMLIRRR